jgi:hypothetical protein
VKGERERETKKLIDSQRGTLNRFVKIILNRDNFTNPLKL